MARLAALSLFALLAAGCGKPLLYARMDAPSVTVTQTLPAVPGAPAIDVPAVTIPPGGFDFEVGDLPIDESTSGSSLSLNGAALIMLSPTAGTDFSGIRSAVLRVTPPAGSSLPPADVASFDAVRDGAAGTRITFRGASDVNLLPYLSAKTLHLDVTAAGTPPGPLGASWTADLVLDFHLVAEVGYP